MLFFVPGYLTLCLSVFILSFPLSFFSHKSVFFFQGARGTIIGFTARAFLTDITYELAIFFKELLETMGEGRRTAKTQAVCLELGPLCSI